MQRENGANSRQKSFVCSRSVHAAVLCHCLGERCRESTGETGSAGDTWQMSRFGYGSGDGKNPARLGP